MLRKIANLSRIFNNSSINFLKEPLLPHFGASPLLRPLSLTPRRCDLTEFFDTESNWGAQEVKSGRSWKKEELRLKSNGDLHKLWYVLLKERNMLMTMEEEANRQVKLFPSPERIDKILDSMENLEAVVRERNVAYHELETGETGERPGRLVTGRLGLRYFYRATQHLIPKFMNKGWRDKVQFYRHDRDVQDFLLKYREKLYLAKRKKRARDFNHVVGLMNRFPDMDMEAVREQYPDVDIERAKRSRKHGGNFVPK